MACAGEWRLKRLKMNIFWSSGLLFPLNVLGNISYVLWQMDREAELHRCVQTRLSTPQRRLASAANHQSSAQRGVLPHRVFNARQR